MEVQPEEHCSSPAWKWQGPGQEVVQHALSERAWSFLCCVVQTCKIEQSLQRALWRSLYWYARPSNAKRRNGLRQGRIETWKWASFKSIAANQTKGRKGRTPLNMGGRWANWITQQSLMVVRSQQDGLGGSSQAPKDRTSGTRRVTDVPALGQRSGALATKAAWL